MDLALYARVIWRFRLLAVVGIIVAILLAVLSVGTPAIKGGSLTLSHRQSEQWTSTSTIWVTQSGFPLGRSIYDQYIQTGKAPDSTPISKFSDPSRFSGLATLYAALVQADGVRRIMLRSGPIDGVIGSSQPSLPGNGSIVLPFVTIAGSATTKDEARSLARRATRALIVYVKDEQVANNISADKRIVLQVVRSAQPAVLTVPRSKTRPVVVFLASMIAVIGLIFLLENLRPQQRPIGAERDMPATPPSVSSRRSA